MSKENLKPFSKSWTVCLCTIRAWIPVTQSKGVTPLSVDAYIRHDQVMYKGY